MKDKIKKEEKKQVQEKISHNDLLIEKGELDPKGKYLYPKGVLNVLEMVFRNKTFPRPRGKQSPTFCSDEVQVIAELLFFKPPHIVLKIYERTPRERDMPLKRKVFINKLLGEAKFNGAKAARMAGYSPRSAKQIAYKIKQT